MEALDHLEGVIGYTFKDKGLLYQAVTHSSYFNEAKRTRRSDNEKLEYLGDAILNCLIGIILYRKYKARDEGFLSNARSSLVKRETLTEIAKAIELERYLTYGGRENHLPPDSKVLSNMLEALIGAIYLDGGMRKTERVIRHLFMSYFTEDKLNEKSPKNSLQEYAQKRWGILPRYRFMRKTKTGFHVTVYVNKELKARGEGRSKKEAEQNAAKGLMDKIIGQGL